MVKRYKIDTFTADDVKNLCCSYTDDKDANPLLTETAGFIPLDIKFKQFTQNGIVASFSESDFDSHDYNEIYNDDSLTITPYDDLEDVQSKLFLQAQRKRDILARKKAESSTSDTEAHQKAESGAGGLVGSDKDNMSLSPNKE